MYLKLNPLFLSVVLVAFVKSDLKLLKFIQLYMFIQSLRRDSSFKIHFVVQEIFYILKDKDINTAYITEAENILFWTVSVGSAIKGDIKIHYPQKDYFKCFVLEQNLTLTNLQQK